MERETYACLTETMQLRRFSTVEEVAANPRYPFSASALRHMIFLSASRQNSAGDTIPDNGLGRAIIRVGRKVLIDLDEFDEWLDQHRCSKAEE